MEMTIQEEYFEGITRLTLGINRGILTTIILDGSERPKITIGNAIPVEVIWKDEVGILWLNTYSMANGTIQFEHPADFTLYKMLPIQGE